MLKKIQYKIVVLFLGSLLLGATAFAISLGEARKNGWVKELPTGYLEVVDTKAQGLVDKVNQKRKKVYQKLAEENKTSIEKVGAQAAKKIQKKLSQ